LIDSIPARHDHYELTAAMMYSGVTTIQPWGYPKY